MSGHGSPKSIAPTWAVRVDRANVSSVFFRLSRLLLCAVIGWVSAIHFGAADVAGQSSRADSSSNQVSLRLRISLGGGAATRWAGNISVEGDSAAFSDLSPCGLNADATAAMRLQQDRIEISHVVATNYNGIDVSLNGSIESTLKVELAPADQPDESTVYSFPVSSLISKGDHRSIDQTGNRCSIIRVPGDKLTFEVDRPHLVFRPGEKLDFVVGANRTAFTSTVCQCRFAVTDARKSKSALTPWNGSVSLTCDESGSADAETASIEVPSDEGVYDLVFELQPSGFPNSLPGGFTGQPKLIRKVQFVVLADSVPSRSRLTFRRGVWKPFARFSPRELIESGGNAWTNPLTSSIAQLKSRTRGRKESDQFYGNRRRKLVETAGGAAMQLAPGGWQAIPIAAPAGKGPCLIEVDCLVEGEAALGISLLQFDAVGQVSALPQDSGLIAQSSLVGNNSPTTQTYRLYLWPNESTAWLVLANRHANQNSNLLDVRVLSGPDRIPVPVQPKAISTRKSELPTRGMMALLESPTFPENFGASEYVDPSVGQPLDDWVTFYEGVDRLIQHLKARNLAGAFVTVLSDGSSLYPSATLQPGPLYDTGCFLSGGNDPMRKDVLELMFRMFQREQLKLIPVVSFNGPLSGLEQSSGSELVDYNGRRLPAEGIDNLPRYNPLDSAVQREVEKAIEELVNRYRHHEIFRGVAVTCRPDTVTLLPGQQWACDESTIKRYLNTTNIDAAGLSNLRSHSERMNFLMGPQRENWLAWRAAEMRSFYGRLSEIVNRSLAQGTLYLAPVDLYRNAEIAASLNPELHSSADYDNAMLRLGFDTSRLSEEAGRSSIVVLNPHRVASADTFASRRVDSHVAGLDQMNDFFQNRDRVGNLFVHRGSWVHFAQLEQEPPFKDQLTSLMRRQQLLPLGDLNRRRFIERLFATDCQTLVDSSWGIPVVEGDSLKELGYVYSQLPAASFTDVQAVDIADDVAISNRSLPVIIRQASTPNHAWFYAVNSSPWPINVRAQVGMESTTATDAGNKDGLLQTGQFQLLSGKQMESGVLEPFDESGSQYVAFTVPPWSLIAGRSAVPETQLQKYSIEFPAEADLQMKKQIYRLQSLLVRSTESPPIEGLVNSGFENLEADAADSGDASRRVQNTVPVGWTCSSGKEGVSHVRLDASDSHEGSCAIRLINDDETPAWIRSNEFSAPQTGRLSVSAWLKTNQPDLPLPLRISLEGESGSGTYYRFGEIGSTASIEKANQAGERWQRFAVHFDDLPLDDLDRLRVGFDLMGPGSVMIDQVEIFDRWLDENDSKAMTQLLATASTLLSTPATYDRCRRLLESYWPRFLTEYIEESRGQLAVNERADEGVADARVERGTKARARSVSWPIKGALENQNDGPASPNMETEEGDRSHEESLLKKSPAEQREARSAQNKFRFPSVFTPRLPTSR